MASSRKASRWFVASAVAVLCAFAPTAVAQDIAASPAPLMGDLNGDGQLTAIDAAWITDLAADQAAFLASHPQFTAEQLARVGDFDGNGRIDQQDVDACWLALQEAASQAAAADDGTTSAASVATNGDASTLLVSSGGDGTAQPSVDGRFASDSSTAVTVPSTSVKTGKGSAKQAARRDQSTVTLEAFTPAISGGETTTLALDAGSSSTSALTTGTVSSTNTKTNNGKQPGASVGGTPDLVVTVGGSAQPVSAYNFGSVTVGRTVAKSFTVRNSGTSTLYVGQMYGLGNGFSAQPGNSSLSSDDWVLSAGQTKTVTVSFTPTAAQNYAQTMTLASNDPLQPFYTIDLSGQGTAAAAPEIDLSSGATTSSLSSLYFGQLTVGSTASSTVTITNRGTATLTVSSITVPAPFSVSNGPGSSGWSLAAGASRSFTVNCTPTAPGSFSARLLVQNNDADESQYPVSLSGSAVAALVPDIAVSGATTLGPVAVGQTASTSLSIRNAGSGPLTITQINGLSAPFSVGQPSPGPVVPAGGVVTVAVQYKPTAPGTSTGTLTIVSDDPDESSYQVQFTGQCASSTSSAPDIDVLAEGATTSTTAYSFGSQVVNTAKGITFTVRNRGNSELVVSAISGRSTCFQLSPELSASTSTDDWHIPAGSYKIIYFTFVPLSARTYTTTVSLASNDPDEPIYNIPVTGTGILSDTEPGTTSPTDPTTLTAPTTPTTPTTPAEPTTPSDPVTSTDPSTPAAPATPTDQSNPVDVGDGSVGPLPVGGLMMGINLMSVNDWNREWPFADAFKHSRGWIATTSSGGWVSGTVQTNAEGWPILAAGQGAGTLMFREVAGHYPSGTYVCTFEGDGDLTFSYDAKQTVRKSPNRYEFTVQPGDGGIFLNITRSNSANPVRNIHVWMPGLENAASPFHPMFVQRLRPFKVLRFMDWQQTNNGILVNWADRPKLTDVRQSTEKGVAYEYIIQLCNELDADPWICVPHQASDDYIRQMATLFRDNLKPGLKVYLEYSNEIWNWGFPVAQWLENRPGTWMQAAAERLANTFNIWTSVWGSQSSRIVRIVAAQKNNPWIAQELTRTIHTTYGPIFDAISCSGYIGPSSDAKATYNSSTPTSQVVADTNAYTLQRNLPEQIKAHADLAKQYSTTFGRKVRFVVYEGGEHISLDGNDSVAWAEAYYGVQTDPGIYGSYHLMMKGFKDYGGDLFCAYAYVSPTRSKYGSWGHLDYQDQPASAAPKWQALLDARNGLWFSKYNTSSLATSLQRVVTPLSTDATDPDPSLTASFD